MFANKIKIMLYVTDVSESSHFWQSIGFIEIVREEVDGTLVIEVATSKKAQTIFVLYDRQFIEKHSPEVVNNTPSLMFYSENIQDLYKKMQINNVNVGDLIQLSEGLIFNFVDNEGNYFAVSELC